MFAELHTRTYTFRNTHTHTPTFSTPPLTSAIFLCLQDDFDSLRPLCYPGTDVFLVCFSVVSPTSFHNVREKWLPEIHAHAPAHAHASSPQRRVPVVLIGTQCDLRNDVKVLIELAHYNERPVTENEAKTLASRANAEYIECSALTQKNLKEVFDAAILAAVRHKGMLDENCNSSPDTPMKRSGKKCKKVKPKKMASKDREQLAHARGEHTTTTAPRTPPCGKRLIPAESKELMKPSKGWKKFCCMV